MSRYASGCDRVRRHVLQSNIITLSRAVGARRALSRHVAVGRGGWQMEGPAPGSGAGRNQCSTFAGDDRGSACSVKSAALAYERERVYRAAEEPTEKCRNVAYSTTQETTANPPKWEEVVAQIVAWRVFREWSKFLISQDIPCVTGGV
jgi:hypothetical protein